MKSCSKFLFCILLIQLMPAFQGLHAQCVSPLKDGDFELQASTKITSPWRLEGNGGIDHGRKFSQSQAKNAWVRNTQGWNAIRQTLKLTKGVEYTLTAYIRTSPNVGAGYIGFRNAQQQPVSEIKFGALTSYQKLTVKFRPPSTNTYTIFAGIWAPNQDAWMQIDNIKLGFPCNDVILNPVNE